MSRFDRRPYSRDLTFRSLQIQKYPHPTSHWVLSTAAVHLKVHDHLLHHHDRVLLLVIAGGKEAVFDHHQLPARSVYLRAARFVGTLLLNLSPEIRRRVSLWQMSGSDPLSTVIARKFYIHYRKTECWIEYVCRQLSQTLMSYHEIFSF